MSTQSIPILCEEPLSMTTDRLEIMERLTVMKKQESTIYAVGDYLHSITPMTPASVDANCRCKMIQWCYTLVDALQLNRSNILIAMNYLDRFLSTGSPRAILALADRREYQLACMTALYIAIKISEPKIMDVKQLSALSRGRYEPKDFVAMESQMLCDLQWRVNGPTSIHFLVLFLDLLQPMMTCIPTASILDDATYQIELAVTSYDLVTQHPSAIAVAALMNSLQKYHQHTPTKRTLQNLSYVTNMNASSSHISQLAHCLHHLQYHSPTVSKRLSPFMMQDDDEMTHDGSESKHVAEGNGHSPKTCVSCKGI